VKKNNSKPVPDGVYKLTVIEPESELQSYHLLFIVSDGMETDPYSDERLTWAKPSIKSISVYGEVTIIWDRPMVLPADGTQFDELIKNEVIVADETAVFIGKSLDV